MSLVTPSLSEELAELQIPDDEIGRQAVSSLRGYIYQIYQTLNAWLTLAEDEMLLLEVAEDFAVLAKGVLTATQVKDTATSGSVTLRTKSVSNAINSLWRVQNANPGKIVRINYLTTSEIGKEKELTFPDGHSGLTYWSVAAREGTDVEPLRQALLSLDLLPGVVDFVKAASPGGFRDRILGRISWVCGAHDIQELTQVIRDRLVYLGERKGFAPSDSERAEDPLVSAILRTVIRESGRTLSRAGLLRIFEKSASVTMPITPVRQLFAKAVSQTESTLPADWIAGTGIVMNAAEVPLPPRIIERQKLVLELASAMGRSGSLWLHGSSGLGKTVLAQLVVHQSKRDWLLVQLRGWSVEELDFRLCRVLQALQSSGTGGVILDDFPTKHIHGIYLRLSMLASEVHRMNGSLIITSAKPPSPNVRNCFGQNGPSVVDVPYLSREEVAELIRLAGGDAKTWAGVVHALSGGGHPQLVQARISGLRQRNWARDELLAGLVGPAKEVDSERESTRERLLSELSPDTRELLYRLTLVVGYFDQEMAYALGGLDPTIARPGEAMDILRGPWVEALAGDRFRVSPLVSDAGTKILAKDKQLEVHKRLVDHLIARRRFPADFLGTVLSHALASRHRGGVIWLTMVVMNADEKDRGMISEALFILPLLDTYDNQPLFKEDILVSVLLRVAQFRVAAWANSTDRLPVIADRLLAETRMISDKRIADGLLYGAIASVLLERSLDIRPHKWLPLIGELDQLLAHEGELIEAVRELNATNKGLHGWTIPQFLFALRAISLKSVGELAELFAELEGLEEARRSLLLSSLHRIPDGKRLMIDAAWLSEMRQRTLQGVVAAGVYQQLAAVAEKWRETDIAVDCECARAVMLNEYGDDSEAAFASLDEADKKYPNNRRLLRERAKVYYGKGDHSASLAIIEQIADAIPKDDHIERAFALREAAISAAKIGQLQKAGDYFGEACAAASASTSVRIQRMAIGLKADCALVKFQSGDTDGAIYFIRDGIVNGEQLDANSDTEASFWRLGLLQVILWMQSQVKKVVPAQCDFSMVVGACSTPDPPDKIMEMSCPPLLASWYELVVLELMLGTDCDMLSELRRRTSTHRILSCELRLNQYLMAKYVITLDVDRFFSYLPEYVSKTAYMRENASAFCREHIYDLTDVELPVISPADWKSEPHLQNAKDAILALVAAALCGEVVDIKEQVLSHVAQNQEAATALRPFIASFDEEPSPKAELFEIVARCLGRLMNGRRDVSPDEVFVTTYRLWEWLRHTLFRAQIEDMIAHYLERRWRKIVKEQRFRLNRPMIAVPAIEAAMRESTIGVSRIARLLLAAEIAVRYRLDADQRSKLKDDSFQGASKSEGEDLGRLGVES